MNARSHVDATVYMQIEPEWSEWYRRRGQLDDPQALVGAKGVTMTQKKPQRQKPGTVLVKLTVRIPAAAFYPLRPTAVVVIPDDMTVTEPLEVTAEDPTGDES